MSRSQDEPPCELEDQFILRLPLEHASTVRKIVRSGSAAMKDKLKIDLLSGGRHAVVGVEGVSLPAKLVDLPCVIESLKTLDKKTFFKTADISQMLVCTADGGVHSHPEELVTSTDHKAIRKSEKERQKKYVWKHGITPPLRNVRKRRFCKATKKVPDFKQIEEVSSPEEEDISARHRVLSDVTGIRSPTLVQHVDSPDVEKQVKRLLCSDTEAVSVRWEVVAEGETEEIESQGFIPGFDIASEMSGYKQCHTSPGALIKAKQELQRGQVLTVCRTILQYGAVREMVNDSSSNSDEVEDDKEEDEEGEDDYDDEDEDKKEEEDRYEVYMESEPQAKFIESGQYEAKEGTGPMVMDIQKQTHYMEKNLQEIQRKAQRQKELTVKVENLMPKSHLQSVLEQLKLHEKQKNKQLISLREKLNYFLKD
ncbi:transcription initiation factor TFIID subunit 7-like [Megaptera novaeangliae]